MANYQVDYQINVNTGPAVENLKTFSAAVEKLMGVATNGTQANQLTKGLDNLSKSFSRFMTTGANGQQMNKKQFTDKMTQITSYAQGLSTALNSFKGITYNPNMTKAINSVNTAITSMSAIKLPNESTIQNLQNFVDKVLPNIAYIPGRFKNFDTKDGQKMATAARYVVQSANSLGAISTSATSLKKAKQTIGALREFSDIMKNYQSIMASVPAAQNGKKAANPFRSAASSINSMVGAINNISKSDITGKFNEVEKILSKFGGLSGNGGVMEVFIDTSKAEANLQLLINKALELRDIISSIKKPGGKNGTPNTSERKKKTKVKNPGTPHKDGKKGDDGKNDFPKNASGFNVYGGGSKFYKGSTMFGGPSIVYDASHRGGGSGGTGTPGGRGVSSGAALPPIPIRHMGNESSYPDIFREWYRKAYNINRAAWSSLTLTPEQQGWVAGMFRRVPTSHMRRRSSSGSSAPTAPIPHLSASEPFYGPIQDLVYRGIANSRITFTDAEIAAYQRTYWPNNRAQEGKMYVDPATGNRITYGEALGKGIIQQGNYAMALRGLYDATSRIIAQHAAFNRQLAENYRLAVAEAKGAASVAGTGAFNPFNPMDSNKPTGIVMPKVPDKGDEFVNKWKNRHRDPLSSVRAAKRARAEQLQQEIRDQKHENVGTVTNFNRQTGTYNWRVAPRPLSGGKYRSIIPKNIGYKVLGPSMLDGGGLGIGQLVKGMGVMYGISGLGQLASSTFKDYADYNNIMQTTMNILGAHDKSSTFYDDFQGMAQAVRNVGVQTKFTAPEVADAAKFLAMAGFNIDDIKKSIRPIADIALVGDTDLGTTADLVTNIMTAYGISGNNVRRAADIMTNTFTMSNTTLTEMAESYKYAAGLFAANGISFQESAGALGVLGNAGVKGSQAGTTMRTIIANLRNPTQKQRGAWSKLSYVDSNGKQKSVETMDENGRLRNLVDIFGDLAKVDQQNRAAGGAGIDMYKLFHKTAAQGAQALVSQVDTWNNIINENFMSDGMVAKLAEAKKNTISGLWAQLTSMFTENGIRSFSKLDTGIRNMLGGAIDALDPSKNSSIQTMMDKSVGTITDLLYSVREITERSYYFYTKFGGFLTGFMKIQLSLMPILLLLRSFRGVQNAVLGFGAMAKSVGSYAGGIGSVGTYLGKSAINKFYRDDSNKLKVKPLSKRFDNGRFTIKDMFWNSARVDKSPVDYGRKAIAYNKYTKFLNSEAGDKLFKSNPTAWEKVYNKQDQYEKQYMSQYSFNKNGERVLTSQGDYANRIKSLRRLAIRRNAIMPIASGVGGIAGGILGGVLGADAATMMGAEEGGVGQMLGSIGGALLMAPALGAATNYLGGIMAAASGASIAIGGIGVGLLYAGYQFYKAKSASDAFLSNCYKMNSIVDEEGHLNLSDALTDMQKRYMVLNETQGDLNSKKERYLELLRKELDMAGDNKGATVQDVAPKLASFLEGSKSVMEGFWNWFTPDNRERHSKLSMGEMGLERIGNIGDFSAIIRNGGMWISNPLDPKSDRHFMGRFDVFKRDIANTMYNFGASWADGTPFSDVYKRWQSSLYSATSEQDVKNVLETIKADAGRYYANIDWSAGDITSIDEALSKNPRNNPYAVYGMLQLAQDIINNPNNLWRRQTASIQALIPQLASGEITPDTFGNFLAAMQVSPTGQPIDVYSKTFDKTMQLEGCRFADQKAFEDAQNVYKVIVESIGQLYPSYRNAARNYFFGSNFAKQVNGGYVPMLDPSRTKGQTIQLDNGGKYNYIYDDSGLNRVWLYDDYRNPSRPKDVPRVIEDSVFREYMRGNSTNVDLDPDDEIPDNNSSFGPSYDTYKDTGSSSMLSYQAPINIESINIATQPGQNNEEIAALFESVLRDKFGEIALEMLNPTA